MPDTKRSSAKDALVDKVLIPLAAAGASALGGYLAKKAPAFVERTVLPKLRDAGGGGGVDSLASGARSALDGTRDVAQTLAGHAQAVARKANPRSTVSLDEIERRREERARHRAERRKATT
jgi:hypothetical protein